MVTNRVLYVLAGSALARVVDGLAPPDPPLPTWWAAVLMLMLGGYAVWKDLRNSTP